jgi:chromosome segregation ATPase
MIKKIFIAALVLVGGAYVVNSTYLGAYVRTAWTKVKTTVKGQVPLEFQLDSLRNEVSQLVPDMRNHCRAIGEETVAIQALRDQIADIRTNLERKKEVVRIMSAELKKGGASVVLAGRPYNAERIRDKLARDLSSCKRCAEELKAREQLLEAKEKSLEAAREQLSSMRVQKEQLEVEIAQMEADLKVLRVAQTQSNFQLDDSRLAGIKGHLADLRNQLKAERIAGELHGAFSNDTLETEKKVPTTAELTHEADAFVGADRPKAGPDVASRN